MSNCIVNEKGEEPTEGAFEDDTLEGAMIDSLDAYESRLRETLLAEGLTPTSVEYYINEKVHELGREELVSIIEGNVKDFIQALADGEDMDSEHLTEKADQQGVLFYRLEELSK